MAKRIAAKHKIDRRMGENIWGAPKSPVNRRDYGPGEHGQRRKAKLSDFGIQLRAKQKLKGYYGNIGERHFRRAYVEAARLKGDTSENLVGLLERRLDAIVYRAKFAPTVFAARQIVNHGHVEVNGRRATIPSMRLSPGDKVSLKPASHEMTLVLAAKDTEGRDVPGYLEVNFGNMSAVFKRVPELLDIPYPVQMEPNLVVEFYSRN